MEKFFLEKFEYDCYNKNYEEAIQQLLLLVGILDKNMGQFADQIECNLPANLNDEEKIIHIVTRLCSATSSVFANSQLNLSSSGITSLLSFHRWISALYASSPFINADNLLTSLSKFRPDNISNPNPKLNLNIDLNELSKICALYTIESEVPLDLDKVWEVSKNLAIGLSLSLLSPRFLGSKVAHQKREIILPWLTEKILLVDKNEIFNLPLAILHDVYMHCSYADRKDKHLIKKSINFLLTSILNNEGIQSLPRAEIKDYSASKFNQKEFLTDKPVLMVVLEWFSKGHSIYRTHSKTIEACKKNFHLIGIGYKYAVDDIGSEIFDEFIYLDGNNIFEDIKNIQAQAESKNVQVLYMPSIGMFQLTMFLSNIRIAPVQAIALGHPATTMSDCIDYAIVEEDYINKQETQKYFSEKLLILPKDGMPYRPSQFFDHNNLPEPEFSNPDIVQICVASTTMKLNPGFLEACAKVSSISKKKVHFNFLVGQAVGLTLIQVRRVVRQFLGDNATVFPHQQYNDYMQKISRMHMFVNPFPFGNTNGIIDTVSAGLVGICKTGDEVHEHIDEGLFRRLNFPGWTIAKTTEKYIESAVRMANNTNERNQLRKDLTGPHKVQKLFQGRPEIMGDLLLEKLNYKREISA